MSQAQAGPTPIRRSARIDILPSPAYGPPPRNTKALPKVNPRESHAYGSSGRVGAADDLDVPVTGFAQAFGAQRDGAVTRDDEEVAEEPSHEPSHEEAVDELAASGSRRRRKSGKSGKSSRRNERPGGHTQRGFSASHSATPNVEDAEDQSLSNVDTSKSFGLVHEAGLTSHREIRANATKNVHEKGSAQNARLGNRPVVSQREQPEQLEQLEQPEQPEQPEQRPQFNANRHADPNGAPRAPPLFQDAQPKEDAPIIVEDQPTSDEPWPWTNFLVGVMFILGAALVFTLVQSSRASTSSLESSSPTLFDAVSSRILNSYDDLVNWINYEKIPGINSPIVDGEGRPFEHPEYDFIFDRTTKLERKTKVIEGSLESLRQHLPPSLAVNRNKKGKIIIPDEYWRALISKLKAGGFIGPHETFDLEWRTFLDKNREKILSTVHDEVKSQEFKEHLYIISRDEVIRAMQEDYTKHHRLVDQKIKEIVSGVSKDVKTLIKDSINKDVMDQIRIESLAYANLVANAELSLRKVNYFSTGLGAHINPFETSSTHVDKKPPPTSLYRRFFSSQGRRAPITALQKWDEPGDSWCAAPDDDGKGLAQLSVLLGHEMYPRQVTIEHAPKQALLDITSAPRDIELWAEKPVGLGRPYQAAGGCLPGPEGYYCLGKFSYNVHGNNHVQTFNLDVEASHPVTKTLLRVTDNWGADHTCIYRVRLHGEPVIAAE